MKILLDNLERWRAHSSLWLLQHGEKFLRQDFRSSLHRLTSPQTNTPFPRSEEQKPKFVVKSWQNEEKNFYA
jgi:hypothetical protein